MMWFIEGGPTMYAILGVDVLVGGGGLLVLVLAIAARFFQPLLWPARVIAILLLLSTLLPVLIGALGWWQGMQMVHAAIEHASPEMRAELLAHGSAIALYPLWFGLGSTVLLGCGALLSLGIAAIPGGAADA